MADYKASTETDSLFTGGVGVRATADKTSLQEAVVTTDSPSTTSPGITNRLFKNIFSADNKRIAGFTPHIGGRGFFIVTKMPEFMLKAFPTESDIFKQLIQFYVKGVSGFQDKNMTFAEINNGIENSSVEIPTTITGASKDITFQFGPELKGQFITKYIKLWMEGVCDPLTHDAHYHGLIDQGMEFDQENHTMEGVYFVTDPSRKKIVFHAQLVNMFPKIGHTSFNDYTQGTHEMFEPPVNFSVQSFENNLTIGDLLTKARVVDLVKTERYYNFKLYSGTGDSGYLSAKDGKPATADTPVAGTSAVKDAVLNVQPFKM